MIRKLILASVACGALVAGSCAQAIDQVRAAVGADDMDGHHHASPAPAAPVASAAPDTRWGNYYLLGITNYLWGITQGENYYPLGITQADMDRVLGPQKPKSPEEMAMLGLVYGAVITWAICNRGILEQPKK